MQLGSTGLTSVTVLTIMTGSVSVRLAQAIISMHPMQDNIIVHLEQATNGDNT